MQKPRKTQEATYPSQQEKVIVLPVVR
jgi:hypothetical protein